MNRFNAQTFVAVAAVAFGLATHSVFGEAAPGTTAGSALPTASLQNPGANSPNGIARPATADSKAQAAQFVQLGREALKNAEGLPVNLRVYRLFCWNVYTLLLPPAGLVNYNLRFRRC